MPFYACKMLDGIIRIHIMLWVRFLFIVAHVIIPHKGSSKEIESNFEIKISLYISGTNTTLTIYVIHFNVIGIITIV